MAVEGLLKKTREGSYRIFLPKLMVEELMGVKETTKVELYSPGTGRITIWRKEEQPEWIDVDSQTEEV